MNDITIIGAGIVGLATAHKLLLRNPDLRICVIDKEKEVAAHQSSHNSGVIHSGIYYKPGSLKALNCKKGYTEMLRFANQHQIPFDICGKIIVATRESERPQLDKILDRGLANGLKGIRKISSAEVAEIEPHVRSVEAIWVPQAGIIDYKDVAKKYAEIILSKGSKLILGEKVEEIIVNAKAVVVASPNQEISTRMVVNCAGLYADKIAALTQSDLDLQILPFRGEYYELVPERESLVKNLIYPVPNPDFPFLGVHYTRMIKGGIEAGPNAVLAFRREGYSRWDFQAKEFLETISFPGLQKLARKYWWIELGELQRSFFKKAFVKALQHLIPEVGYNDLVRGRSGVRAMACDHQGNLIDDFLILESDRVINVCNAPSPAATASLAIGNTIAKKALARLN